MPWAGCWQEGQHSALVHETINYTNSCCADYYGGVIFSPKKTPLSGCWGWESAWGWEAALKRRGLNKHTAKGKHVSHGVALISPASPATSPQQCNYTDSKCMEWKNQRTEDYTWQIIRSLELPLARRAKASLEIHFFDSQINFCCLKGMYWWTIEAIITCTASHHIRYQCPQCCTTAALLLCRFKGCGWTTAHSVQILLVLINDAK